MSDGRPKPSIPAWQRATQPKPPPTEDPVSSQPESTSSETIESTAEAQEHSENSDQAEPESVPSDDTSPTTAPVAQHVEANQPAFGSSDFETFRQHEQQQQQARREPVQSQPPVQQSRPNAPPIITYPEFLVEAHKPPPFITPTRVLNALYVAGGASALLYGASKWLIQPMVDTLSESRHDLLSHSQSKVDEFNERLTKLVSKVPDAKKEHASETDVDDAESETSDPTELYHRDMGTQTSPPPSRSGSLTNASEEKKKDAVTYQTGALDIMREHIKEINTGSEKVAEANKDRQESLNKLRHYLDELTYSKPGVSYNSSEDALKMSVGPQDDALDDLKKEIRGVKGVLLSAKRFPAVSRPMTGAA